LDHAHRNSSNNTNTYRVQLGNLAATIGSRTGRKVGIMNDCLRAFIDKGFVKAGNFKRNTDKLIYLYLLTPKGIEEKASLTTSFLKRKIFEHEIITQEIAQLKLDTQ